MKRKELNKIADQIVENEKIIQYSKDMKQKLQAEANIMELSGRLECIEDILMIDEIVQEKLKNLTK